MLSKMKKIKVVQYCLKWRENWLKMTFGGRTKFVFKNEKNQSSSILPEMARKLIKNVFFDFLENLKKF